MLPEYINKEAWLGFVEMRIQMSKKGWTPRAEEMALNKLKVYHNQGFDANKILDDAVFNCWKGLFAHEEHKLVKADKPNAKILKLASREWAK